ncbi:MAG: hypothetical protein WCV62_02575 [Candidatus Peribacteraceae bacterium]|jgi:hypothetical protein
MFLHPAKFGWDPMHVIHADEQDHDVALRLPARGYGRAYIETVDSMQQGILILSQADVDRMADDLFADETPEFQRFVWAILDSTSTHPASARGEYTFVLSY